MNNQRTHLIRFGGGLDTSTAPMGIPQGCVIGSKNYQERLAGGGYERVRGYERFDGRPRPSDAEITVLQAATDWDPLATIGSTATGAISGATGVVCYRDGNLLALTKVVGDFDVFEQLLVGASPVGLIQPSPSVSPLVANEMYAGAEAIYRADIGAVPGSGPIRGVCVVAGEVYAFRDNAGATAQAVWRATTSGWVAVALNNKARFSAGSSATYDGFSLFTLTQGAASAPVLKVMTESGSWSGGTAAGTLIIGATTGGSLGSGAATGSPGSITLTLDASPSAVTLFPGGRWQFKPYRFSLVPSAVDEAVFGVDRVGNGSGGNFIEFDGTIVAPLTAGGIDGPYRLEAHRNHLFVVHRRTGIQFSGLGDPYRWTVLAGAGEVLAGEQITEMISVPGSEDQAAMLVICRNRTFVLYGNSSSDFSLKPLSRQVGAKQYSAQIMKVPVALDDQGVRTYIPTQAFGNFTYNTLTDHVRRDVVGKTPVGSAVDRDGGRYRLFFDDGTWLSGTPGKRWSWAQCEYPFTANFVQDWELDDESVIFAGGESGYVYMLDRGRSFDGVAIEAWLKTAYAHFGSPQLRKAIRRTQIEIRGDSAGEMQVQADFSYGDTEISANAPATVIDAPIPPPASPWDLGVWDRGTWDSNYTTLLEVRSEGVGENVALTFYSLSAVMLSHHITAAIHYWIPRRMNRGS